MWVRVSRFEGGSAEQFDEGMRYLEEHVLPAARQMAGWKGVTHASLPISVSAERMVGGLGLSTRLGSRPCRA